MPGYPRVEESTVAVGLLSGSHAVNHMYFVLLPPLFGVLALEFDVGLGALGAAMGVLGFAGMVCQLPYGYLADHHDRLLAFGLSSILGAAGAVATALAPTYAWLVVGQALLGIGVAGHHPAHYPMIVDATDEDRRGRALGVYEFAGLAGFAATPVAISAVLATGFGWRYAVGAIGVLGAGYSLVAAAFLLVGVDETIRMPSGSAATSTTAGYRTRLRGTVRGLLRSPAILAMAVFAFLIGMVNWGFVSYVVVLLTEGYAVPLSAANVVLTGVFVFSGIWVLYGGVIIDTVARGPDTVIAGSFGLASPLVAIVATLAISPIAAVVVILLVGAAQGPSVPAVSTVAAAFSAEENLGRNMAVISVGTYAGNGIAPPILGVVIEGGGLQTGFMLIAIMGLVASFLMLAIARRFGDHETLRPGVAAAPGD